MVGYRREIWILDQVAHLRFNMLSPRTKAVFTTEARRTRRKPDNLVNGSAIGTQDDNSFDN
jgi:hypothetical protein